MKGGRNHKIGPHGKRAVWHCLSAFLPLVFVAGLLFSGCADSSSSSSHSSTRQQAPTPPAEVSITAEDGACIIEWIPVNGATSYNVYWSTSAYVTKETGIKMAGETSPCVHDGLTNGTTYYYVVTAVNSNGESAESQEVGATPLPPVPGAPQNVRATIPEEVTNTIEISWDPVPEAAYYNLYWDNTPGVTADTGNGIVNVVSPFLHTGLFGQTVYYYVVTAVDSFDQESDESYEVNATPRGPRVPPGGEEGYGNNLSYPVALAEGYGIAGLPIDGTVLPYLDYNTGFRPTASDIVDPFPYFDPASAYEIGGITYYEQKTASTWQADWADGSAATQQVAVLWGDNLVSTSFNTDSVIRVETVLTQNISDSPMNAYTMQSLYGTKRNEMFGTDTTTYESDERTLYTVLGHLKVQKIDGLGNVVCTHFDKAVYESFGLDGPGGFSAEINTSGKLLFGYIWFVRDVDEAGCNGRGGTWRLTFSVDETGVVGGTDVSRNVEIVGTNHGIYNTTEASVELTIN